MRRTSMKVRSRRHLFFRDTKVKADKMTATPGRAAPHAGGHSMRADNMA